MGTHTELRVIWLSENGVHPILTRGVSQPL